MQLTKKSGICDSCFIMAVKHGCLGTWSVNAGAVGTTQVHPKGLHAMPQAKGQRVAQSQISLLQDTEKIVMCVLIINLAW